MAYVTPFPKIVPTAGKPTRMGTAPLWSTKRALVATPVQHRKRAILQYGCWWMAQLIEPTRGPSSPRTGQVETWLPPITGEHLRSPVRRFLPILTA